MAQNLRIGSRVKVMSRYYPSLYLQIGTIARMPGNKSSGTAGFKFVEFDDGQRCAMFTRELERIST